MTVQLKEITVAHSPDSDDIFMFYALAHKKIKTDGLRFKQIAGDIQKLNQEALLGTYEVTAISFAVYPQIKDRYFLTTCGASMGENYGPVLIARKPFSSREELKSAKIAIPGKFTTAYLCLQLFQPGLDVIELPFDQIINAVSTGRVDAGLLIHEGQIAYKRSGVVKVLDLGQWWYKKTNLPLPLGGNAIRKDLGSELIQQTTRLLKESIVYSLKHRGAALEYVMGFTKNMSIDLVDHYIDMYVNDLTVDCGERGRLAVKRLFAEAHAAGIFSEKIVPEFVGAT